MRPAGAWPSRRSRRPRGAGGGGNASISLVLVGTPRRWTEGDRRRDGQHLPVIATNDLPIPLVHHPVMPVAKQSQVGRFICSAVSPVLQMMSRAPARRPLAARPGAVLVANVERLARRPRYRPLGPPDIDDHGLRAEHDPRDRRVAGESLDCLGGDWY